MAKFEITAWHPVKQETKKLFYDTSNSTLLWEDGKPVIENASTQSQITAAKIEKGKRNLKKIKIQLGLSCNFECEYCNQRFVPHADQSNPSDVTPFVNDMVKWFDGGEDGLGLGVHFEFWGGEPFVYWKTFKPLAELINKKYPNSTFTVITNGSLIDEEKIEWLDKLKFSVGVSHDGPGQWVRGPDPFNDPKTKNHILELYKRLAPQNRIGFNSMINSKNISRKEIQQYFINFITENIGEEWVKYLCIGEGGFIDAYDMGGVANSLTDSEIDLKFRNTALNDLRSGSSGKFQVITSKVFGFIETIHNGTKIESVPQKCGMDKEDNIAIDLFGNVLTCQNVSPVSKNPAGISHLIGHVSDLENVDIKTSKHWSEREECPKCPVVHLCKGACMFLDGQLWEVSCDNSFSDAIVPFSIAIEELTGYIPMYIEGPQREDRKDIFGWMNTQISKKSRKIIPITAI